MHEMGHLSKRRAVGFRLPNILYTGRKKEGGINACGRRNVREGNATSVLRNIGFRTNDIFFDARAVTSAGWKILGYLLRTRKAGRSTIPFVADPTSEERLGLLTMCL
jgi:hypothetical protein